MTEAQLRTRTRYWQSKLTELGINQWNIDIKLTEDDPRGMENSRAAISTSKHYDTAWLEFNHHGLDEASPEEIDQTIIHELLHISFRDLDESIHYLDGEVSASAFLIWDKAVTHATEKLIERLARQIYALSEK